MGQPLAEVELDEPGVRALLAEQHPDLAGLPLQHMDAGWDNQLWRLADDLVVRLPRRRVAVAATLHEQRWLPVLARRLPLPVPEPVRLGTPGAGFPWPWTVVRAVPGEPGDRAPLTEGPEAAAQLAGFLRALHAAAPADAPVNPFRGGATLASRQEPFQSLVASLDGQVDASSLRGVWGAAVAAPPSPGRPVWLHADLHPANVMVTGGRLSGVVDFGDMCAGDRAIDLAAAWVLLPDGSVGAFFEHYGEVDEPTLHRARGWAALFALMVLDVGLAGERGERGGKPSWTAPGRAALRRLTS